MATAAAEWIGAAAPIAVLAALVAVNSAQMATAAEKETSVAAKVATADA